MTNNPLLNSYDYTGKTVVITGGAGVLGAEFARALFQCGANIAILDLDAEQGQNVVKSMVDGHGITMAIQTDILDSGSIIDAVDSIITAFGKIDFLINGAGGNNPKATTGPENVFFDLPAEALRFVTELNLLGTILPSQVIGKQMAVQKSGSILNISSMNAFRPLTKIPAYSAAKAAVSNFTQWLAVHMAQEYSANIRVNAIAPGFFLTEQNRFLLTDKETGELTHRGKTILEHTPMKRFGKPEDLIGAVLWLLSPAAEFVTGVVLPIDGGFSAYSGV